MNRQEHIQENLLQIEGILNNNDIYVLNVTEIPNTKKYSDILMTISEDVTNISYKQYFSILRLQFKDNNLIEIFTANDTLTTRARSLISMMLNNINKKENKENE